jgi:coenzyme F420-0:L-glutamate ligase/coenzyme F420-1:gamma-L-glutamate ligase
MLAERAAGEGVVPGDVLAVAHKVVSKAEGRVVALAAVRPGPAARALAAQTGKEPALCELILAESRRVVRRRGGTLICETHQGLVCANAGIDSSNVPGEDEVLLLPADPDASARRLRAEIATAAGCRVAVVISDSFGRPWRVGQADVAIGCAGIDPIDDRRGTSDRDGRELRATEVAIVDQLAAAADLCRDKAAGLPASIVRGLGDRVTAADGPGAAALQRDRAADLFR